MVPPRRPWTLLNWLLWASLLLCPFFRFLVNMVSSGSSLTLASFVLVFFVGKRQGRRQGGPGGGRSAPRGQTSLPASCSLPRVYRPGTPTGCPASRPLPGRGVAVSTGAGPPGQVGSDWHLQVLVHTGTDPQLWSGDSRGDGWDRKSPASEATSPMGPCEPADGSLGPALDGARPTPVPGRRGVRTAGEEERPRPGLGAPGPGEGTGGRSPLSPGPRAASPRSAPWPVLKGSGRPAEQPRCSSRCPQPGGTRDPGAGSLRTQACQLSAGARDRRADRRLLRGSAAPRSPRGPS